MKPSIYIPIGTSILMYISKPSDASFHTYLLKILANHHPNASTFDLALVDLGIRYGVPIDIKDYGIIKIASITIPKDAKRTNGVFIGAFQKWFFIGENSHD